ncbi:MAG TPA: L-threonylcarbamoyladenylate synthase [Gammaproteobacteria bacterium]|nr:L-threonylcarbamoyladenylate synthase [Gammaproteobacteria bacterium]
MKEINKAIQLLKKGECVAIPTETVYGLAADANNPKAIKKIFALKGRPQNHPLILHIASVKELADWVETIPENAKKLMKSFWPGPMTLIFAVKKNKLKLTNTKIITGNQNTIGIRMPSHPIARKLLKLFKGPVVAPSANKFGHVSPTRAEHVKSEFGNKLKLILDGGRSSLGIESTIIDITETPARLLRPGPLSIHKIKKLSGVTVISTNSKKSPRVSGSLKSHYAPKTPVILFAKNIKCQKNNIAVMSITFKPNKNYKGSVLVKMPNNPDKYAQKLYAVLRTLDHKKLDIIYIETPPNKPEWLAVRDRLMRAAK